MKVTKIIRYSTDMEPEDMIMVVEEAESENMHEDSKGKSVEQRSKACQTAPTYGGDSSLPVIFCALFSSVSEASTQADIPRKVSIGVSTFPAEITTIIPKTEPPDNSKEQLTARGKERDVTKAVDNVVNGTDREWMNDSNQDDDYDTDELLDETPLRLSPSNSDNDKESDDSDFTSDSDDAFWAKMRLLSKKSTEKHKSKLRSGNRFLRYPTGCSNNDSELLKKVFGDSDKPVELPKIVKQEPDCIEDDWITDDEVDDENVDINLAFKQEWKKKRHPYNSKEKNFVCEVCGKLYSKHNYLREHIVRDHRDHEQAKRYPYSCEHCMRLYSGQRQLEHHKQQQSGPCEICGVMLKCSGQIWIHKRNHHVECSSCGKSFNSRNSLDMHIKVKHREKTVPCPLCPRMFSFKFLLRNHMNKMHQPGMKTPHKCDSCDYQARTELAVRSHQRLVHNIESHEFKCTICQAKFSMKYSLKLHMSLHQSGGRYACDKCPGTFDIANHLRAHKKEAHAKVKRKYTKRKRSDERLEEQQDTQNTQEKQSYHCSVCNTVLTTHEELNGHMTQYHDNQKNINSHIVESIQLTEMSENAVSMMQINVNNEGIQVQGDRREPAEETSMIDFSSGINFSGTRSALLMPASVVPPNVNMVDIDGIQYHVIRGSQ